MKWIIHENITEKHKLSGGYDMTVDIFCETAKIKPKMSDVKACSDRCNLFVARLCVVMCHIWIAALSENTILVCNLFLVELGIRWYSCPAASHRNDRRHPRCSLLSLDNLWCCLISRRQNLLPTRCLIQLVDSPSTPVYSSPSPTWEK